MQRHVIHFHDQMIELTSNLLHLPTPIVIKTVASSAFGSLIRRICKSLSNFKPLYERASFGFLTIFSYLVILLVVADELKIMNSLNYLS